MAFELQNRYGQHVCAFHPCRLHFPLRCHQDPEDTLTRYDQERWPLEVGGSHGCGPVATGQPLATENDSVKC